MQIIAICNRKGGCGKSTTAHALGAGLMQKGYSVLYVDLDSQANLSYFLQADPDGLNAMDLLTGKTTAAEVIQHTSQGDIIPGADALAVADGLITETGKEYKLKEALDGLQYDFCIIDTPGQLGILTINALTAANKVNIPVQADITSLHGIGKLIKTVDAVKKYCNQNLTIDGILITRYNGRAILSKDMQATLQEIAEQLNTSLYDVAIREGIAVKEAQASQQDIFSYSSKSNAAADYSQFVDEFLKRGKQ